MLWEFKYKIDTSYWHQNHKCIIIADTIEEAKKYFYKYIESILGYDDFLIEDSIKITELDAGNHIIYAD